MVTRNFCCFPRWMHGVITGNRETIYSDDNCGNLGGLDLNQLVANWDIKPHLTNYKLTLKVSVSIERLHRFLFPILNL